MTCFALGFGLYTHSRIGLFWVVADFAKDTTIWPAAIADRLADYLVILDTNGQIQYTSPSGFAMAGYSAVELHGSLFCELLHPDDQDVFVSEFGETVTLGSPFRMFYRLRKKDRSDVVLEAAGHAHIASAIVQATTEQSAQCEAVFIAARPYPTAASSILDTFLEHNIENERLQKHFVGSQEASKASLARVPDDSVQRKELLTGNTASHGAGLLSTSAFYQDRVVSESLLIEHDAATIAPGFGRKPMNALLRACWADLYQPLRA